MVTARSSSFARPSGRGILLGPSRCGGSDVERRQRAGDVDVSVENLCGLGEGAMAIPPRHEVGEQKAAYFRPRSVLARLLAGEVDVGRVVLAFQVRRLAEEDV